MRRTRRQLPPAFTLIEVLLAVAVFGIVLLAIHGVFYGALRLRHKATQTLERAVPLQHALAVIQRDLANMVLPGGRLFGPFQTDPSTSTNVSTSPLGQTGTSPGSGQIWQGLASPPFFTARGLLSDRQPWGEVEKVFYYLADPTNQTTGKDLYRSVNRNLLPVSQEQSDEQWLLSGVQGLAFSYYNGMTWQESWDSSTAPTSLPQAIKVQIQLATEKTDLLPPDPIELVVPLMVQAATNQTETAQANAEASP